MGQVGQENPSKNIRLAQVIELQAQCRKGKGIKEIKELMLHPSTVGAKTTKIYSDSDSDRYDPTSQIKGVIIKRKYN